VALDKDGLIIMEWFKSLSTGQVLEKAAKAVPNKTAVVDGERRKTFKELHHMADALAASFSELGFGKGDRVAIYMPNSIELMAAFYALQKLGVIVVWVNPNYRVGEAHFMLANSEAKGVVLFREWDGYDYLDSILDIKGVLPNLKSVILAGDGKGEGVYSFYDLLDRGSGKKYSQPHMDTKEDLSMFLYTSGTTGRPKGAMISHYAAVRAGWEYSRGVMASSEDRFIAALPMSHSYGCGAILIQPTLLQSTLVLMDKFDTEKAFRIIEKEKVTLLLGAPTHYILALSHKRRKEYDLSSLRAGLIAGYTPPEGLITRVEEEMDMYITSFWGASEVGPGVGIICPYPSPLEIREKYIGRPVAGTKVRIVDPASREEVPEGEIGELTLSGWHVMKGYWRNPEETEKQIVNGWLFMGDLVSQEKDGYIKIYGRTKDLINRGGYKIYPHELESLIIQHPKVDQACVVSTPNPVLGESTCACVIPRAGEQITLIEVRDFLRDKMAPHKLPDELCLMTDFPRLSGGVKINKFGKGGLTELAEKDENRERHRK
jgi:acyl-CoA synthetase (AMP-forming)/AMP-acid ligase II